MQYLVRCMLSDLPLFILPVPHLGQDNMVRKNNVLKLWNPNDLGQWSRSMSHKSSVSGMEGPLQAIRVINEKQLLVVFIGINILQFWERICKVSVGIHTQARAGELRFLTFEEI
jgi:hypothetical protein